MSIRFGFVAFLSGVILTSTAPAQTTNDEMLVSSRNSHSVKRYDGQTGVYIDDFVASGAGGLSTTQDLATGPDGNILVSGRGNTAVLMFDRVSGYFIREFTTGYVLDNPTKISYGPDGNLYVSQWGVSRNQVARFNGITGEFMDEVTPSLNLPLGHVWDAGGNLYVACYGSSDVRKFDENGTFVGIFTEAGHLQGPTNLWFDGSGSLFVVDWVLGSVERFDSASGSFTATFISGLQNAEGYAFGADANLYLCDWSQNHVRRYTPDGQFLGVFADGGNLAAPNSILFRPVQVTTVDEGMGEIPERPTLHQNFPNPFNPTTTIRFTLPVATDVSVEIHDVIGRHVAQLLDQRMDAGTHSVRMDASTLSGGVYFCRVRAGRYVEGRRMMLVK